MQVAKRDRAQKRPPQADRDSVNLTCVTAARLTAYALIGLSDICSTPGHARPSDSVATH